MLLPHRLFGDALFRNAKFSHVFSNLIKLSFEEPTPFRRIRTPFRDISGSFQLVLDTDRGANPSNASVSSCGQDDHFSEYGAVDTP